MLHCNSLQWSKCAAQGASAAEKAPASSWFTDDFTPANAAPMSLSGGGVSGAGDPEQVKAEDAVLDNDARSKPVNIADIRANPDAFLKNVSQIEHDKRAALARSSKQRSEAQAIGQRLSAVKLTLSQSVGEGERLYGSITSKDVVAALKAQGIELDKKQIVMEPIRALGVHKVQAKLAASVSATFEVNVIAKT